MTLLLLAPALLGGCSSLPSSVNPVSWWHGLEGGAIAEQRPPPPGANEPYPNLATVPARPAATDASARRQIADALIADRTNAQHEAALAPLPDPSSPAASPALFGQGSATPPAPPSPAAADATQASASLAAATPPARPNSAPPATVPTPAPAPAPAPTPAPVTGVQSAPLGPAPGTAVVPTEATQTAALPTLPAAPPAAPALPGVPSAVAAAAPASRPAAASAPKPAPAPAAAPAPPVAVAFAPGSAELPASGVTTLRSLAARRGANGIVVTGYGEASSADPGAQSSALSLGVSRAQAMVNALAAAGVPASSLQIDAEAAGRGGTARLVD